jgi:hypothetical protein
MMPMPRITAAVLLLLGLATPAFADRALIVGIDIYKDPLLTFQLQGASMRDSERIHKLLTGVMGYKEDEIRFLRNEQATRKAMLEGLNGWLGESKPGERVFFYYVGHGHFQKDTNGDESDGLDETLVPYDAAVRRSPGKIVVEGMLIDDEIAAAFDKLKGRTVTAVIDSCHSGTVTRSLTPSSRNVAARTPQFGELTRAIRVDPTVAAQKQSGPAPDATSRAVDVITWTAVSPTQLALIDEEAAPDYHGLFTAAFADGIEKGLADKNKNGVISNQELLDYVRSRSADYCKRHKERCEMGITPALDGVDAATKVAARNPAIAAQPVSEGAGEKGEADVKVAPGQPINQGKPTPEKIMDLLGASLATDIVVEQIPPSPVRLGTTDIHFRVTAPRDGFLVLLSVSDEGEVVQLFPNALSQAHAKSGRIRAGSPILIPDPSYGIRFDATSVTKGTVIALVATDPINLSPSFVTRRIEVIPQDEVNAKVLPELAQSLAKPANEETVEQNTKPVERSVATLRYEITP